MSIADIVIYTFDWIFQHTILLLFPTNVGGLSLAELQTYLSDLESVVVSSFSGWGFIAPVSLILTLVVIVASAEFVLFLVRTFLYILKLIRG